MTYDCLIIGAGPAGQEAGLFLGRAKLSALVIGVPEKSDLAYGKVIGNVFGASEEPSGLTLLLNGVEQLKRYGIEVRREEAVDLKKTGDGFEVTTDTLNRFSGKSVILATGQQLPTAGIKGEKAFLGKGVATCVACDGPLFKGKSVAVVGNGAHAAEEAIELADYAMAITVYSQGKPWEINAALMPLLKKNKIVLSENRIAAIEGETLVNHIVFKDKTEAAVDGVFLATGTAGGVTFAYKLGLELENNFVRIDRDGKTSQPGVWAAGGITGGNQQIAKSMGEGCNAALSVIRTLKGVANYVDQT